MPRQVIKSSGGGVSLPPVPNTADDVNDLLKALAASSGAKAANRRVDLDIKKNEAEEERQRFLEQGIADLFGPEGLHMSQRGIVKELGISGEPEPEPVSTISESKDESKPFDDGLERLGLINKIKDIAKTEPKFAAGLERLRLSGIEARGSFDTDFEGFIDVGEGERLNPNRFKSDEELAVGRIEMSKNFHSVIGEVNKFMGKPPETSLKDYTEKDLDFLQKENPEMNAILNDSLQGLRDLNQEFKTRSLELNQSVRTETAPADPDRRPGEAPLTLDGQIRMDGIVEPGEPRPVMQTPPPPYLPPSEKSVILGRLNNIRNSPDGPAKVLALFQEPGVASFLNSILGQKTPAQLFLEERFKANLAKAGDVKVWKDANGKPYITISTGGIPRTYALKGEWAKIEHALGDRKTTNTVEFINANPDIDMDEVGKNGFTPEQAERFEDWIISKIQDKGKNFKSLRDMWVDAKKVVNLPLFERSLTMIMTGIDAPGNRTLSDQMMVTMFNKLTDPGTAVREGEYARTEALRNLWGTIKLKMKKTFDGSSLLRQERLVIQEMAQQMVMQAMLSLRDDLEVISRMAIKLGFEKGDIIPQSMRDRIQEAEQLSDRISLPLPDGTDRVGVINIELLESSFFDF